MGEGHKDNSSHNIQKFLTFLKLEKYSLNKAFFCLLNLSICQVQARAHSKTAYSSIPLL